jgi:hypothetical protein
MTVAFLAMVMPTAWMAATADWLEIGPLPRSPLVESTCSSSSGSRWGSASP